MKFLAIEQNNGIPKPANYQQLLRAEAAEVWKLYELNTIREIYFNDANCAVIILECKDKQEATNYLSILPLVKENLISFEITELKPYTGFERLFQDKFSL